MLKPVQISSRVQKVLPLDACLAKTVKLADGNSTKGINVSTHCQIVGHVAVKLIRRQPQWLQKSLYPKGSELVAAAHDLGKVSPHFQEKIYSAAGELLGIGKAELDNTLGGHATISQACVQGIASKFIPEILGRHHGSSPTNVGFPNDEVYGGPEWQQNRLNLLAEFKNRFACDGPTLRDENQANVLSGLTCVADWIGSGSLFDGVHPDGQPDTTPDGVVNYLHEYCKSDAGIVIFQRINRAPGYKIRGVGGPRRELISISGLQLILEKQGATSLPEHHNIL